MMHIIATNACIVIRTLVKESSKEMMGHDDKANSTFDHLAHHCQRIEIIGEAIEDSSVYLYPFIIEYSIIGISVLYRCHFQDYFLFRVECLFSRFLRIYKEVD